MAGVAFAVEGDGVGFATESYAASALYATLASLSDALWRIRRAKGPGRPAWAPTQDAARDHRTSGRGPANASSGRQAGVGGPRRAASAYSHVLRSGRLVGAFG